MVGEIAPVGCAEQRHVGPHPGREPAAVGRADHVRRVDRHRDEGLLGGEVELRAGERCNQRQAGRERAARVEVRRERDRRARIDERTGGRHRAIEEQRARRQQHGRHVARAERARTVCAGRLEMIEAASTELDGEGDRAALGELVAVQAQCEPGRRARLQVPSRLRGVEGTALQEHVRSIRELRGLGEDVAEDEVEVGIGVRVLRRDRMCSEPRGRAAC